MVANSANDENDQVEIITDAELFSKGITVNSVDYKKDPCRLFRSLKARDWRGVLKQIGESSSEIATWVSRTDADGNVLWRMLPIHASIVFDAPDEVTLEMLSLYPDGCSCKDDQGMLPLHLAFRTAASDAVLYDLLKVYPKAVEVKDNKGRTPLELYRRKPETEELPIDPLVEGSYGCRLFPQFLDSAVEVKPVEITPPSPSNTLANTLKPTGIALYLEVFTEIVHKRTKWELKESMANTITCADDEFNVISNEIKKQATDELDALKEKHSKEIEALKDSYTEDIKKIVDKMNIDSAQETDSLRRDHLEELEMKEIEIKSSKDCYEEELKTEDDEFVNLNEAYAEEIKDKVDEVNAMKEAHIEELKSKDDELNSMKKAHSNELMVFSDEMQMMKQTHEHDIGDDNDISSLNESHKKETEKVQEELDRATKKYETLKSSIKKGFGEFLDVNEELHGEKS